MTNPYSPLGLPVGGGIAPGIRQPSIPQQEGFQLSQAPKGAEAAPLGSLVAAGAPAAAPRARSLQELYEQKVAAREPDYRTQYSAYFSA